MGDRPVRESASWSPARGSGSDDSVPLREHLEGLLLALREQLEAQSKRFEDLRAADQRAVEAAFAASEKAVQAALASANQAVKAALDAAEKAVLKAELNATDKFKLLNELRVGVVMSPELQALREKFEDLKTSVVEMRAGISGRSSGLKDNMGIILFLFTVVGFALTIWQLKAR